MVMIVIILIIVYISVLTRLLNKLFFPYGKHAFKIIYRQAEKDFKGEIKECKCYLDLQKGMISALKKIGLI